jgi:hypothetical protein
LRSFEEQFTGISGNKEMLVDDLMALDKAFYL